jgi:hypothetical protein
VFFRISFLFVLTRYALNRRLLSWVFSTRGISRSAIPNAYVRRPCGGIRLLAGSKQESGLGRGTMTGAARRGFFCVAIA